MFEFESNRITIDVDLGGKNNVMLPESARVSLSLVEDLVQGIRFVSRGLLSLDTHYVTTRFAALHFGKAGQARVLNFGRSAKTAKTIVNKW